MFLYFSGKVFCVVLFKENLLQIVGIINVNYVLLVQCVGYQVIYFFGGGVVVGLLGLFDFGIFIFDDVLIDICCIIDVCLLLLLVDVDIGFGFLVFNVVCMVKLMIKVGVVGLYIEDQVGVKCCGYCLNKVIVLKEEMVDWICVVVDVKIDFDFVIMVCIDVLVVEGLDVVIECVQVYVEVGVEMLFLEVIIEFVMYCQFVDVVQVLIFVNIIEFGVMLLFIIDELCSVYVVMVLYLFLVFCVMNCVVEYVYNVLCQEGMQKSVIDIMQICNELYESINYYQYEEKFDNLFVCSQVK